MDYAVLAEAYGRAETTTKRLELAEIVAGLLEETPLPLVAPVVHLTQGRLAPDFEGIELGLSEKMVITAIAKVAAVRESDVVAVRNRVGDVGTAAEELLGKKTQKVLFRTRLTARAVLDDFLKVATTTGSGSQDTKLKIIQRLLSEAEPIEARYLVRTVTGKLRLGIQDATVLDALAALVTLGAVKSVQDMGEDERKLHDKVRALLEHANDVSSDLGKVAATVLAPLKQAERRLLTAGRSDVVLAVLEALEGFRLTVGVPVRAMLAERLATPAEILEKLGGRAALEYKYDGLRIQAHIPKTGPVRLFSRRLEDLTAQFPDVAEAVRAAFAGKEAVVEGEAVAIDAASGRMLPFQVISRRRGRKEGLQERDEASQTRAWGLDAEAERGADALKEFPIRTFLFDLLMLDGRELLSTPYEERRRLLQKAFRKHAAVEPSVLSYVTTPAELDAFLQSALAAGAEGLMAKNPASAYKAGGREWSWIKYKADYVEGLADTFDLAVIGAYHGQGRRAGWYGAFLLAAWDPDAARFVTVCRVATGFDDPTLEKLKDELAPDEREIPPEGLFHKLADLPDVWLEPRLVLEVSGAEFTLSPVHTCAWGQLKPDAGLAVRFPRFTGRLRTDKDPTHTTTPAEIVSMYQRQVKVAGTA